jgi:hypothetical protein
LLLRISIAMKFSRVVLEEVEIHGYGNAK